MLEVFSGCDMVEDFRRRIVYYVGSVEIQVEV